MKHRTLRVANLLRDELSSLLVREFEFPGAIVTITDVVVSDNMERADVFVSALPLTRIGAVLERLNRAAGELQYRLLRRVNIKPMPLIRFAVDPGPAAAANVEKLLMEEDNTEIPAA